MDRGAARWVVKHAAGVFAVVALHVDCVSLFVFVKKLLLEVPVIRLGSNRKLKILFSDGVPVLRIVLAKRKVRTRLQMCSYLVNHHYCKEVADGRKKQAIHVMFDALADVWVKDVE